MAGFFGLKVAKAEEPELLRRYNEAIALDHVIPYRLITSQTPGEAVFAAMETHLKFTGVYPSHVYVTPEMEKWWAGNLRKHGHTGDQANPRARWPTIMFMEVHWDSPGFCVTEAKLPETYLYLERKRRTG